jgi:3-oxoacyl-ACP reductase-like protein
MQHHSACGAPAKVAAAARPAAACAAASRLNAAAYPPHTLLAHHHKITESTHSINAIVSIHKIRSILC